MLLLGERARDAKKIAVLRANGLGDYVFALPALEALRAGYPDAEIVYLGKPWHRAFLTGRPGPVDRVIVVPLSTGVREEPDREDDPAELDAFFADMARERFDIALQLHGGGRNSNPFLRRLGARLTAGLCTDDAIPLDRWIPYVYFQSEYLRYLEVVGLVGAAPVVLEPRITVTARDLDEARAVVPVDDKRIVLIHPGGGDTRRRWATEKFAAVGDALARAGAQVVVSGSELERDLAQAVVHRMNAGALNVAGYLSLGGLAGLLARCRVVVSNDSGPLHLAGAVGAATVGIFWGLNLITAGFLTRARHRPHLGWTRHCPVCDADEIYAPCAHATSLVDDVRVDDVLASALDLLHGQ